MLMLMMGLSGGGLSDWGLSFGEAGLPLSGIMVVTSYGFIG
jgi:hypothetical protein